MENSYLWRALAVTLLLLPVIYLSTRLYARQSWRAWKGRYLEVIEVCSLGPRAQLFLVRALNRLLLVAAGEREVRVVAELGEALEVLAEEEQVEARMSTWMEEKIARLLGRWRGWKSGDDGRD